MLPVTVIVSITSYSFCNRQRVATKEELLAIKPESGKRRLKNIEKHEHEYDPSEFWLIVTDALDTGLRGQGTGAPLQ